MRACVVVIVRAGRVRVFSGIRLAAGKGPVRVNNILAQSYSSDKTGVFTRIMYLTYIYHYYIPIVYVYHYILYIGIA